MPSTPTEDRRRLALLRQRLDYYDNPVTGEAGTIADLRVDLDVAVRLAERALAAPAETETTRAIRRALEQYRADHPEKLAGVEHHLAYQAVDLADREHQRAEAVQAALDRIGVALIEAHADDVGGGTMADSVRALGERVQQSDDLVDTLEEKRSRAEQRAETAEQTNAQVTQAWYAAREQRDELLTVAKRLANGDDCGHADCVEGEICKMLA